MTTVTFSKTCNGDFVFEFVYKRFVVSVEFGIRDPMSGDISDFEAVSSGQGTLTFCEASGANISIHAKNNTVSFEILNPVGNSEMKINLPFALCQRALVESFHERQALEENSDDDE